MRTMFCMVVFATLLFVLPLASLVVLVVWFRRHRHATRVPRSRVLLILGAIAFAIPGSLALLALRGVLNYRISATYIHVPLVLGVVLATGALLRAPRGFRMLCTGLFLLHAWASFATFVMATMSMLPD